MVALARLASGVWKYALRRRVLSVFPNNPGRFLEIGFGRRPLIFSEWYGVDKDIEVATLASRGGLRAVCGTVYSLPFKDGSYDTCLISEVLEHLQRPTEALKEVARVLRPGGVLIVTTPNKRSPVWWTAKAIASRLRYFDWWTKNHSSEVDATRLQTYLLPYGDVTICYACFGAEIIAKVKVEK